jgi:hypothetical protein
MTGIKHNVVVSSSNSTTAKAVSIGDPVAVSTNAWNADHVAGTIADVLTDHTKAVHDALAIDAATLNSLTAAQIVAAATTTTYFRSPPKYTVTKEGSAYHVYKEDGSLSYSTASLETAVNDEAFNGLTAARTYKEKVLLKGNLELDSTLLIPNYTKLTIDGKITLANTSNCHMLQNGGTSGEGVVIDAYGATLDFNGANQGNQDNFAVDWEPTVDPASTERDMWIKCLRVINARRHGIQLYPQCAPGTWSTIFHVVDCTIDTLDSEGVGYAGFRGLGFADGFFSGCHFGSNTNTRAMNLSSCGNNHFSNMHFDGGVSWDLCYENQLSSFLLDGNLADHHFIMEGCRLNQISNGKIRFWGSDARTTFDGVNLAVSGATNCTDNGFANLHIGRSAGGAGTNTFRWGIHETDANQDNNQYVNINGGDCNTGALRLLGAASQSQHQNVVGTVTEA